MFLSPSVLSLDYANFKEQLDVINKNCKWIHFDVMDGHFVPNLSFGPDILKTFRKNSDLFLDVHLMVSDPDFFSDIFIDAGADGITFHLEAYDSIEECQKLIEKLKAKFVKVGVSIKPNTDVEKIIPLLKDIDLVLVMSVEPGFGGQKFMPNSLDKIKKLAEYRKVNKLKYLIQIDGGINDKTGRKAVEVGCDVLVAGSYIFKGNIKENIDSLDISVNESE